MRILLIHQNFPGQFKSLAPALAARGDEVVALTLRKVEATVWKGVRIVPYTVHGSSTPGIHPWLVDFETKTLRGEACFKAALRLRAEGFVPDVILAHPGWGESLFLKEVWPAAKLAIYGEFYYHREGGDVGFDPEFPALDADADACRLRLKNMNSLLHFELADAGLSPTHWQASTFPAFFRDRITVIHDGIDTEAIQPAAEVSLTLNTAQGELKLSRADEVITYVSRNLEPYRGYHVFMRALPELLRQRPKTRVLIVGGDSVSYGAGAPEGQSWKAIFAAQARAGMSPAEWSRVHFLGRVPYPAFISLLQLSAVHVYLTYPFVLSWSLLEAMSAGCAIVASDTAPLHEAITHGVTGRLVGFFEGTALIREVITLLDDPAERLRLGANARHFAQTHYDLQRVCLPQQLVWVDSLS